MFKENRKAHDAFRLSLGGMGAKSPFFAIPAIADGLPDRVRAERRGGVQEDQPDTAREIENVLAYYFAPGRCHAA